MSSDLQQLVDDLCEALGRSVAIDDRAWRLVAYSSHEHDVDRVRMETILHRDSPADAKAWVTSLGIADATGPVVAPANPQLGMVRRVCIPIRHRGWLLGYVWLTDPHATLDEADLQRAVAIAERAGELMHRQQLLDVRGRERDLLRTLLTGDEEARRQAAGALAQEEHFVADRHVHVVVLRPVTGAGTGASAFAAPLEHASERLRRIVAPHAGIGLPRLDHAVLLLAGPTEAAVTAIAEQMQALAAEGAGVRCIAGISAPLAELTDAPTAYERATMTTRVAEHAPVFGDVVRWRELGVYRVLAHVERSDLPSDLVETDLRRLAAADRSGTLVKTLEAYLDLGGDAQATAGRLHLHRASLYARLNRIQDALGASLRDGETRLALHLAIKVARLRGICFGRHGD